MAIIGGELDAQPREWAWRIFRLNPVVTIGSLAGLWGLAIWSMSSPDAAQVELQSWKTGVTEAFTWFCVMSHQAWVVFILVLYFSKYGSLKLCSKGEQNKPPEFNNAQYFMMLFSAGVGISLFLFGVVEPVRHYIGPNRYTVGEYRTDNEKAQWAITLTMFHWGAHGWVCYAIIAICLAFVHFRMNMPLSMRSCFYPLVGNKIFGWFGDLLDIFSIIVAVAGVCISLGFGVHHIASGLLRLSPGLWDKDDETANANILITIIWCITALAAVSVVSGLNSGIKHLSIVAFMLGCALLSFVTFADNTWLFLNVVIQSIGHYFQNFVELGLVTDSFAQLSPGDGGAPDGKAAATFMDDQTVLYWGWWVAWSPFVGVFLARISRGRTIREVITYSVSVPALYCFVWFGVFGAAGITMQNKAQNLAAEGALETYEGSRCYETDDPAHSPVCDLGAVGTSSTMWFIVIEQYYGLGNFLTGVSIVAMVLYFITSSDSGSLVVEYMAANGHQDPRPAQRILWALTVGACATGLVKAGGVAALQAASVTAGLPYTVIICLLCTALWRMCREACGDLPSFSKQNYFSFGLLGGVFDVFEWVLTFGYHPLPSSNMVLGIFAAVFCPGYYIYKTNMALPPAHRVGLARIVGANVLFYLFIMLRISEVRQSGLWAFALTSYVLFCVLVTNVRTAARNSSGIHGSTVEDFFAVLLMYPQVCVQMVETDMIKEEPKIFDNEKGIVEEPEEAIAMEVH
ncbi:unnamed protein product [Discosporangium mesarthrocarpum]